MLNVRNSAKKKENKALEKDVGAEPLKGKPLIIEFVGPTGSGKTTNCKHFSDVFKKNNINAYVFKDVKDFLSKLTPHQRLHFYLRTVFYSSINLLFFTVLLVRHGIFSINSITRFIKLCIFDGAVQRFIKTQKVDVLFLDQWIIQGLWSATIFKAKSYSSLERKLPEFYFKTEYVLFFDIDEETACERIQTRGSDLSRFDQMHPERRLTELKRYNLYLQRLYENSTCKNKLKFSTTVSPQKNAEEFYNIIKYTIQS